MGPAAVRRQGKGTEISGMAVGQKKPPARHATSMNLPVSGATWIKLRFQAASRFSFLKIEPIALVIMRRVQASSVLLVAALDEAGSPTVMFHRVAVGLNGRMDWT
jgi:hypothetical protein